MKIESYTHSVKVENEDVFGVTEHGVFVMDGASALEECHFTPEVNDVVWLVRWWQSYLMKYLDAMDRSLQDILEQGVKAFNEAFSRYKPVDSLSKLEQVSSGLAVIRFHETFLECFVLGDVEISVKGTDGAVEILTDDRIKPLDEQVIELMTLNKDRVQSCVYKDFTQEELALLKKNRMKMNTEEGYYILSHDVMAISKGIYKVYQLDNLQSCLLSSDGLSLLDRYYTRNSLIDEIKNRGVKSLVDELRNFENEDTAMLVLKRLKSHDDATAIYIEF